MESEQILVKPCKLYENPISFIINLSQDNLYTMSIEKLKSIVTWGRTTKSYKNDPKFEE